MQTQRASPFTVSEAEEAAQLQVYLDALPYSTENAEEMNEKLEFIVARLIVCAETQDWNLFVNWDGLLGCWMLAKVPLKRSLRGKLIRLYYELACVPGMEPRNIKVFLEMIMRLVSNKQDGKRRIEAVHLELPWEPLWRVLKKELWPKGRARSTSRNVLNILMHVAEQVRRFYPASAIPEMLDTFLPYTKQDNVITIVSLLAAFLPSTHLHLYLPTLFSFWEAFNSYQMDEHILGMLANASEKHISGEGAPGASPEWKDVAIYSEAEWQTIVGKCLGSMHIPVGSAHGASTTGAFADTNASTDALKLKKPMVRMSALAQILIYSMYEHAPIRGETKETSIGYLAGSKALESLDQIILTTESFFHPSNSGTWSVSLTAFMHNLTTEFAKRWKEEEDPLCVIPVERRLTKRIRFAFVRSLLTPALLSMFSKDAVATALTQGALKVMAMLEPNLVMPQLLERAYGGLETVNETHRTTAVLSCLSGVTLPLVSAQIWPMGQKHLVPLLNLCIPGIDLNDPAKTITATMFIIGAVQHLQIADLTETSSFSISNDVNMTNGTTNGDHLPDGAEPGDEPYDREEEAALARESTAGFADWVTSFFRRVLALYENLPEEGAGRKVGGKSEESVLKSIRSALDTICMHLSDSLFQLVLKLVHEYGTTNARSNSIRAFSQMVSSLARARPRETLDKFFPFCAEQIKIELEHGASGVRTTSTHSALPSDTTLHWNLAIIRGILSYAGSHLLRYRSEILELMALLVDKAKGERAFSSTGRLLGRMLSTLTTIYPLNNRCLNAKEWDQMASSRNQHLLWGKLYESKDIKIEWHVPSTDEVAFALQLVEEVTGPALDKLQGLVEVPRTEWDSVWRNDLCRYLHFVRATWAGLSNVLQEGRKTVAKPLNHDTEVPGLTLSHLEISAGFVLTDPNDPRYKAFAAHRERFGRWLHVASQMISKTEGEDHIDAVIAINKGIDVYLLEYGVTSDIFGSQSKHFTTARDHSRLWPRQNIFPRSVWVKRAQVYHTARIYLNSMYRLRSAADDDLLTDLAEFSMSPYTRVRKISQGILSNVACYYVRSTRLYLPLAFNGLDVGADPDRMKGALHMVGSKATAGYAMNDRTFAETYLTAVFKCEHQEKPSIQKLVAGVLNEAIGCITEEGRSVALKVSRVQDALRDLESEFPPSFVDAELLREAVAKRPLRIEKNEAAYDSLVNAVVQIAESPSTHWRYAETAVRTLVALLRRDRPASPNVARVFMKHAVADHPNIRWYAQRGLIKLLQMVKWRTYSQQPEDAWLGEARNPLSRTVPISDPSQFVADLHKPISPGSKELLYYDKIPTGFLIWGKEVRGYLAPEKTGKAFVWDPKSQAALEIIRSAIGHDAIKWFSKIASLYAQEPNRSSTKVELRMDHIWFISTIFKMFEGEFVNEFLEVIEPLWTDSDRFKQRAAAELITGILRGIKHWNGDDRERVWSWVTPRLQRIFSQMKLDTNFWESLYSTQLNNRDPRRSQPLIDWGLSLPLDFNGDSAFTMAKAISVLGVIIDELEICFEPLSDKYINLLFDNAQTLYAEIRGHIAQNIDSLLRLQHHPSYQSTNDFLDACASGEDPLKIYQPRYVNRVEDFVRLMPQWKKERLPPPRVNQSQYDKVGLTLLQWIWNASHGAHAPTIIPYVMPILPEILRMSELNDSSELQVYSTAVLYILSAVSPPRRFIEPVTDIFIEAVKSSPSWRVRLHALPILSVFYVRNMLSFSATYVSKIMDVLLDCLQDENVEVREMAAESLSGLLRCSQRQIILPLKTRFTRIVSKTTIPPRTHDNYATAIRTVHSAVLGLVALINAYPYSVEDWMPPLTEVLARHSSDPPPIAHTIRKAAAAFKKTHTDTWHADSLKFDEDQLQALSTMLSGTSYYA